MTYTPQNAKEINVLPSDLILDAAIISIRDGVTKDFIENLENWKGDINAPAIQVCLEAVHNKQIFKFDHVFNYRNEGSVTLYSPKSNLGKYKKKYGKLPEVGDIVKALTNSDGFLKLKLN